MVPVDRCERRCLATGSLELPDLSSHIIAEALTEVFCKVLGPFIGPTCSQNQGMKLPHILVGSFELLHCSLNINVGRNCHAWNATNDIDFNCVFEWPALFIHVAGPSGVINVPTQNLTSNQSPINVPTPPKNSNHSVE